MLRYIKVFAPSDPYIDVVINDAEFEVCMLSSFERVQIKSNQSQNCLLRRQLSLNVKNSSVLGNDAPDIFRKSHQPRFYGQ